MNSLSKKTPIIFLILFTLVTFFAYFVNKSRISISSCVNISEASEKTLCWKKIIDSDLAKGNLNKTMDLVSEGYSLDPIFAKNCHDFMHSVGRTAYDMFLKGENFKVGDKTSYCAYGFYHGFMESLVSRSGDITLARSFCKKVDDDLAKTAPGAKLACYHGIGHGWTNVHDPKAYGNERAMVSPALALCEKVTSDPEELKICATGVFDSISIAYYNETDGLKMNKNNPYWLCQEQSEVYKKPCYMDLTPAVVWLGEYKLDKSFKYLKKVETKYLDLVIETISEDMVRFIIRDSLSVKSQIEICRSLGEKKSLICIGGLAKGYMQFGAPGKEEYSGLIFCENNNLTSAEKDSCIQTATKNSESLVSKERFRLLCSTLKDEYKKYCQ